MDVETYNEVKRYIKGLISRGLEIIEKDNKILLRYGYNKPSYEIIDIKEKKSIRKASDPSFYKEYTTVEETINIAPAVREITFYLCNRI